MSDVLAQSGVLGMRWGRRKARDSRTLNPSSDHILSETIKKKHLSEMSNDEIKKVSERLDLEKKYKTVTAKEVSKGRKAVDAALLNGSSQWMTGIVASGLGLAGGLLFNYAKSKLKKG